MPGSLLGTRVRRVEDPDLLTGRGTFVANLQLDGMARAAFVRSPLAHARIEHLDISAAAAAPGVVAVLHRRRHRAWSRSTASSSSTRPAPGPRWPATRSVSSAKPVAIVVAETEEAAVDAAELVVVDYQPLDAVVDAEAALADGAPLQFEALGTNLVAGFPGRRPATRWPERTTVVRAQLQNQRVAVVPMEGDAIAAVPGTDGAGHDMTVHVSTQMPHGFARTASRNLGLAGDRLRVVAPHVGGGFGGKAGLRPSTPRSSPPPAGSAPGRVGRDPLGQPGRHAARARPGPVHRDGLRRATARITGMRCRVLGDAGAYAGFGGALAVGPTRIMAQGVYRIPAIRYDVAVAVTNTTPMGAFRGAGRPEAAAFLERIMDMAADELGIDPVEIRRRNLLPPSTSRSRPSWAPIYDTGDYERALTRRCGWPATTSCGPSKPAGGPGATRSQLGIGVSAYVEITAGGGGNEFGSVEVHATGRHHQGRDLGPRPGPRHRVRHDRLRPARHPDGGHPLRPVRYRAGAPGRRYRRLPLAADRRQRRARRRRQVLDRARGLPPPCSRPAPTTSSSPTTAGSAWPACPPGRSSWAELARLARPTATRTGAADRRRSTSRSNGRHIPLRRPRGRGRGGHRDGAGAAPPPRRGRRLRPDPQPAARDRPAARRDRPGHGPGAVGAVRLRRGRQPADLDPGRVRHAERGRVAVVRVVQHRDADAPATRSAPRASASRGRSARLRRSTTP